MSQSACGCVGGMEALERCGPGNIPPRVGSVVNRGPPRHAQNGRRHRPLGRAGSGARLPGEQPQRGAAPRAVQVSGVLGNDPPRGHPLRLGGPTESEGAWLRGTSLPLPSAPPARAAAPPGERPSPARPCGRRANAPSAFALAMRLGARSPARVPACPDGMRPRPRAQRPACAGRAFCTAGMASTPCGVSAAARR